MKIKPYIVLGLGTAFAIAAVATVVTVSDPQSVEPGMMVLFWLAGFLAVWGLVGTILNIAHFRLSPSLSIGFVWALAGMSIAMASQHGFHNMRLWGGIMIVTLVISLYLWRRAKLAE